jgi:flagellar biosynthesis GTPase FlhF
VPSFASTPALPVENTKKKEKAHLKTPIPGTDWLRVKTTEGNVFYSNKATKQSSWTVPPEIVAEVNALEQQEQAPPPAPDVSKAKAKAAKDKEGKRKRDEEQIVPLDELVLKKAKIEEDEEEDSEGDSNDEEEEEWQREAAEQLAREAEEERIRQEEEAKRKEEEERRAKEEEEKAKNMPKLNMPEKVELSVEEGKALFKVRSPVIPQGLRITIHLDATARERYQSFASLGSLSSQLYQRPKIRPPPIRRLSQGSL